MLGSSNLPLQALVERIERLKFVLHLTRDLNSTKDVDVILRSIVEDGVRAVDAERSALFLLEDCGQRLTARFAKGLEEHRISVPAHAGLVGHIASTGEALIVPDVYLDQRFNPEVDRETGYRTRSLIGAPLRDARGRIIGVLQALNRRDGRSFDTDDLEILECLATQAAVALENARAYRTLLEAKETIRDENELLKERLVGELVGVSSRIRDIRGLARHLADSTVKVLITGERGTGKSLFARTVHFGGECCNRPFIHFNLAAVPAERVEDELFGVRGGAPGKLESADGGTLFLDEVGAMPDAVQRRLLGFLQSSRLGEQELVVRLISATNRDLEELVRSGRFIEDLFYRLNVVQVSMPPLRSRSEDIRPLIDHLLQRICRDLNHTPPTLAPATLDALEGYAWPGNVRELHNELTRLVLVADGGEVPPSALSASIARAKKERVPLSEAVRALENRMIQEALDDAGGNKVQAARLLGISREGLRRKMQRYGMDGCSARLPRP